MVRRVMEPGSVGAQALYHLWSGVPAVTVSSPPGAGKTETVTQVVHSLVTRANYTVAVATPNRAQAAMLANRLSDVLPGKVGVLASSRDKLTRKGNVVLTKPRDLNGGVGFFNTVDDAYRAGVRVVIANSRKWMFIRPDSLGSKFDLMVVDEAYQVTWSDFAVLAGVAPQLFLVGDPGQIPPIVSCNTSRFEGSRNAPHVAAPQALMALYPDDTVCLQLPSTYRCGPATAAALQPLYPFSFVSTRPDSFVSADGARLPEIAVEVIDVNSPHDVDAFAYAADVAMNMVGQVLTVDGVTRVMEAKDVCVVTAHVHQAVGVRSRLGSDFGDITVDTVERTQGSEWAVVVALDPANGYVSAVPDHNSDTGRLCVALSRASAHTRWIMASHVQGSLTATGTPDAVRGYDVRNGLLVA